MTWKPIEEAPKDGSKILAISPDWLGPVIIYWNDMDFWAFEDDYLYEFLPESMTHYIEIPSYEGIFK